MMKWSRNKLAQHQLKTSEHLCNKKTKSRSTLVKQIFNTAQLFQNQGVSIAWPNSLQTHIKHISLIHPFVLRTVFELHYGSFKAMGERRGIPQFLPSRSSIINHDKNK